MSHKVIKKVTILFVTLCFTLSVVGCSARPSQKQVQSDFNHFLNNLFVQEVQSDTLSLNYSLANPESYGIKNTKTSMGDYGIDPMKKDLAASENYLNKLQSFDYKKLTSDQKLTYDIVKNYLNENLQFGDYLYYNDCLGPTTGIQAQLPILLAEYSFYNKSDIEEYLKLLPCIKNYFQDIIKFEQEKSKQGLFMSDKVATRIIEQCEAFIKKPEENFLIQYFNERISGYKGLTPKEVTYYEAMNKEAVLCYVVPAYQDLINALTGLLGTGTNELGLYYFPKGKDYYESLAQFKTGSGKSMKEMIQMLDTATTEGIQTISDLSDSDPNLWRNINPSPPSRLPILVKFWLT